MKRINKARIILLLLICMYILMECFLFVKKKIYKETNNNAGK